MRPSNSKVLTAVAVNANIFSAPIWAVDILRISVQAVVTDAPNGKIKLQASNDVPVGAPPNQFVPTNWSDIGTEVTIGAAGVFLIPYIETSYQYLRVFYTDSSGGTATGALTASIATKGL